KREKAVVNSPQPIYDQEPTYLIEQDAQNVLIESEDMNYDSEQIEQNDEDVDLAKERSSMVQKSGIQCYNCKEYGHVARECPKLKKAKDAAYHREKMLLCKQEEAGIQLNVEQADWRDDTDDESDDQELEAHYMYMAKLQQVSQDVDDSGPIFDKEPEQKVGCYNDNLALMLSPETDEVIRLEKESRSKLSDLVSDYAKLNSLYNLFVPQREKSSEQRFF
nr:hypothetical protein [Tanacetum cinerariifolium]